MLWRSGRRGGERGGVLAITLAYALAGGLWILVSDRLLERYVSSPPSLGAMQTVKGLLYVLITAGVLYPLLRRWERHMRRSEARYRALFDGASDAVFVREDSADGRKTCLLEANRVACEWLGYSHDELLALPLDDIDGGSLRLILGADVGRSSDGAPGLWEGELTARDGRRISVEVNAHRLVLDGRTMVLAVARDVSERRAAQAHLAHERDLLHALMDNIPDQIYFKGTDSCFTRINPAQARVLGLGDPAEAIGRHDIDYFVPDHARDAEADEHRILATGRAMVDKIEHIRRADGEFRWVTTTKAPIKDEDGRVTGTVGISRDITERRLAEQALRIRDVALNASMAGMISIDLDGIVMHANPSFAHMWGYGAVDQVLGLRIDDLMVFEEQFGDMGAKLWREGRWAGETRAKRRDGSWFDAQIWASIVHGDDGEPLTVTAWAIDITERLNAERALRASEEKYRLLVENANEVIIVAQDGWLRYVNRRAEDLFGVTREQLVDSPITDRIHPEDRALVMERHRSRLRGEGYPRPYAFRVFDGRNEVRWVELSGVAMEWEGKPASLNFLSDITERKLAEDALRDSEERYRTLVDNQGEGIAVADADDRFTFANPAAEEIFGVEPGTLAGRRVRDFVTPEQFAVIEAQTELRRQGHKSTYEIEVRRRDGEVRAILLTATPQCDRTGRFAGTFGIFRDVTERRRADEERERLITELQEALAHVKTLRGLLPICASCKKVRDDGGYWHMVETYVRDHSQAEFTHTLCPDCMARLYPQYVTSDDDDSPGHSSSGAPGAR